jgi:hypothetical protein
MKRNPKELETRTKEMALYVAKTNHLHLEFCQDCGWPMVVSVKSKVKAVRCADCRDEMIEKKQWEKRCEGLKEVKEEVTAEVPVETQGSGTNEEQPSPIV